MFVAVTVAVFAIGVNVGGRGVKVASSGVTVGTNGVGTTTKVRVDKARTVAVVFAGGEVCPKAAAVGELEATSDIRALPIIVVIAR